MTLLVAGSIAVGAGAPASHGRTPPAEEIRLQLPDGTPVTVVRGEDAEEAHAYRYLPANLTLARTRDGMPEFSFLAYQEDSSGPILGGIMHVLLRWGLSEKQEDELQRALRSQFDTLGTIVGAAPVRSRDEEDRSWEITSKGAIGSILNRSVASSGHVPTAPESKLAISFRFDAKNAMKMSEALRSKRGTWGEKIRFLFTVDDPAWSPNSRDRGWALESDLGLLLPRIGS